MHLKASKKTNKPRRTLVRVYDADTDEIVAMWLRMPSTLECPLLQCCEECGRCIRK